MREGKFQAGGAAAATASVVAVDAAAAWTTESSKSATPTGNAPGGPVFERQIEEVEEAKEVLRKAGAGSFAGGPGPAAAAQWGGGGQQQGDVHVKVQVQPDGKAPKMRYMGDAEEADRDEGALRS